MAGTPKLIEVSEAIEIVGRGLYGDDWIGRLTQRQIETCKALGPRRHQADLPEMIEPCPQGRTVDLDRALGRQVRMAAQRNTALDWIFCHRIISNGRGLLCDRAAIEKALAAERVKRNSRGADGAGNKRGRPSDRRERIVAAMRAALDSGELTVDSLRGAKQQFLAERFDAARKTCADARKIALALLETPQSANY